MGPSRWPLASPKSLVTVHDFHLPLREVSEAQWTSLQALVLFLELQAVASCAPASPRCFLLGDCSTSLRQACRPSPLGRCQALSPKIHRRPLALSRPLEWPWPVRR